MFELEAKACKAPPNSAQQLHLIQRDHLTSRKHIDITTLHTHSESEPTLKMFENAMDDVTLKQYLADDPPTVVPLAIKPHFEALKDKEKKYAHYISRASMAGTKINLRQVSPESEAIYDFILELHKACGGKCGSKMTFLSACLLSRSR